MRLPHFHLTYSPPNKVWPEGCWGLYQITGDEIAQRIKFDEKGEVVSRWPWCGYIGTYATLAEVTAAIDAATANQ